LLLFYPDDVGIIFLRNVGKHLPIARCYNSEIHDVKHLKQSASIFSFIQFSTSRPNSTLRYTFLAADVWLYNLYSRESYSTVLNYTKCEGARRCCLVTWPYRNQWIATAQILWG
jgi:hypothetical protein